MVFLFFVAKATVFSKIYYYDFFNGLLLDSFDVFIIKFLLNRHFYKYSLHNFYSYDIIRKVASPHVRFALQIRTAQGNLTLLNRKNL